MSRENDRLLEFGFHEGATGAHKPGEVGLKHVQGAEPHACAASLKSG